MENQIVLSSSDLSVIGVKEVIDSSDKYLTRVRVKFNNGYGLSIIRGEHSYGGRSGLFEIAQLIKTVN